MKKYTLEDVQQAALDLSNFVVVNTGKCTTTDALLEELKDVNLIVEDFEQAKTARVQFIETVNRNRAAVYTEIKKKKSNNGYYVLHDLICAMAHFGFVLRYAIKDTEGEGK